MCLFTENNRQPLLDTMILLVPVIKMPLEDS